MKKYVLRNKEKMGVKLHLPKFECTELNVISSTYLGFNYSVNEIVNEKNVIVVHKVLEDGRKEVLGKHAFNLNKKEGSVKFKIFDQEQLNRFDCFSITISFGKLAPDQVAIDDVYLINEDKEFSVKKNNFWSAGGVVSKNRKATPESPVHLESDKELAKYLDGNTCQKNAKKVLMIVGNGIEGDSRVLKSASSLKNSGYSVVLLGARRQKSRFEAFQIGEVDCITTHNTGLGANISSEDHEKYIQQVAERLGAVYYYFKPDVLYTHDYWGLDIGASIFSEHYYYNPSYWMHDIHEFIKGYEGVLDEERLKYALQVEREKIKIPDKLISVNEAIAHLICEEYDLHFEDFIILPNVPREQLEIPGYSLRNKIGISETTPLGVYLGRATELRGLDLILHTLQEIEELHIVLFSASLRAYTNSLNEKAKERGVSSRLHIFDYVPDYAVAFACREADFGLSPLKKYGNSDLAVPTKVYEYIHAEIPVVASDTFLQKKFIEQNDIGLIFRNKDGEKGLLDSVKQILNPSDSKYFKNKCLSLKETYKWDNVFKPIVDFIDSWKDFPQYSSSRSRGVFQGPAGSAGQPAILASGLREINVKSQAISIHRHSFAYNTDIIWPASSIKAKASVFTWASHRFDVFHFHYSSIFNFIDEYVYQPPSFSDLLILKGMGKKIVFHFRGSEVRVNKVFGKVNKYAWSENEDPSFSKMNDKTKIELISFICSIADSVLVVDPELNTYVPQAKILERAISKKSPALKRNNSNQGCIKIVHAPSRRHVKGSKEVIDAVNKLISEGFDIKFQLVEGKTNAEALKVIESADLVIDQLVIGWYGVLAVEAMSMGIPVLAYIREDLWEKYADKIPIINTNKDDIYYVLKDVLRNKNMLDEISAKSINYFEEKHALYKVAMKASEIYADLPSYIPENRVHNIVTSHVNNYARLRKNKRTDEANNKKASNNIDIKKTHDFFSEAMLCFRNAVSFDVKGQKDEAIKEYAKIKNIIDKDYSKQEVKDLLRLSELRVINLESSVEKKN